MFDPLNPGPPEPSKSDAWPSSPHQPGNLPPHLSPTQHTPIKFNPSLADSKQQTNDYAPEPKVYGMPSPALMSPTDLSSNPSARIPPFVRIKISGMERNRKDLLVRFDATSNLPTFRTNIYKNIQRSYVEIRFFAEHLATGNPQAIVPALPLPQSSAVTDEEDDRLVRLSLQRWLGRICEDPVLMRDEELRSFIESDFGYNPVPRPKRKAVSSGFKIPLLGGSGVLDEDETLANAKYEVGRLGDQFADAAKALDKLAKSRKSLALAEIEFGVKTVSLGTVESFPALQLSLRKLGRAFDAIAGMRHSQSLSELVVVGDTLGYQSLNSRAVKETLIQRTQILEEFQSAAKVTISKRRVLERMKGGSNIAPAKVDEAVQELEEATQIENKLFNHISAISTNLHESLSAHSRNAHEDIAIALLEHARLSIMFERSISKELEALVPDVKAIGHVGAAGSDTSRRIQPPVLPSAATIQSTGSTHQRAYGNSFAPQQQPYQPPHPPQATQNSYQPQIRHDGTQSMYVASSSSNYPQHHPQQPAFSGAVDPLGGVSKGAASNQRTDVGTGSSSAGGMARSMVLPSQVPQQQAPPPRRRLDEREAASKLANMF